MAEWSNKQAKDKAIKLMLDLIANGQSLKSIIDERTRGEVPCYATWLNWVNQDAELLGKYMSAREEREEKIFDEILSIADDTSRDTLKLEKGEAPNAEWISRSRLKVDARKWYLGKLNSKRFGDKVDVTTAGDKIESTTFINFQGKDIPI
ncbi:MAG: hypothetical protein H7296_08490 [Bacteroidia bacterium]|nr:hypothetical protein [Bacteroidia bacterium]